jgi:hypothetical protein
MPRVPTYSSAACTDNSDASILGRAAPWPVRSMRQVRFSWCGRDSLRWQSATRSWACLARLPADSTMVDISMVDRWRAWSLRHSFGAQRFSAACVSAAPADAKIRRESESPVPRPTERAMRVNLMTVWNRRAAQPLPARRSQHVILAVGSETLLLLRCLGFRANSVLEEDAVHAQ